MLKEQGVGFITALRAPQIQALTVAPDFQLSLFDERGLSQISYGLCCAPEVKQMVDGECGKLKNAPAGKIGERAGRVVNKRKMAKHFSLQIADGRFGYSAIRRRSTTRHCLTGST